MSLVELGWRRFTFFDQTLVKDSENIGEPFLGLQDLDCVRCCACPGDGLQQERVLIGERTGGVCALDGQLSMYYWRAHSHAMYDMSYAPHNKLLITVGEDEEGVNASLKVWNLDKLDTAGVPFCSRMFRTQAPNNRTAKVCCLCVSDTADTLIVGFEDSTVLMYKADLAKDKSIKPITVRDGISCAADGHVTALAHRKLESDRKGAVLFVATRNTVVSYLIQGKTVLKHTTHNARGCQRHCSLLADAQLDHQFIVAKTDLVHFYNPEQCAEPEAIVEGKCQGFEADKEKMMIASCGSYLLLVTTDHSPLLSSASNSSGTTTHNNLVNIYDVSGRYVAFNGSMGAVQHVFTAWGSFLVLCQNGRLFKLTDKPIHKKLDVLFRKNLFDVAIGLAKRHFCNEDDLRAIFKQHGDYLYEKSDYDNAVQQYIQTIGTLEPSYVMRKFLDAQRVSQLSIYLEALHEKAQALKEHTTILLNCYTRLGAIDKIDAFIDRSTEKTANWTCDTETAIKVLHKANYMCQACRLAERDELHETCVRIKIDDLHEYAQAVQYIEKLDQYKLAVKLMNEYGKKLLQNEPERTTSLLKRLVKDHSDSVSDEVEPVSINPANEFLKIFVDDTSRLREFLEFVTQSTQSMSGQLGHVSSTLLELYLIEHSNIPETDAEIMLQSENKILQFMRAKMDSLNVDQALVLCRSHNFTPGLFFIYERSRLYKSILAHCISGRDFDGVLECCKRYGDKDASLWTDALYFVANERSAPASCVRSLIGCVDKYSILPPMMVLEILAKSETITLSLVKEYLTKYLKQENESVLEQEKQVKEHASHVAQMNSKIKQLKETVQVFQISKCSACDAALEVPTVHFLCNHSYHKHCYESYAEADQQCPVCAPEIRKVRQQLRELDASKVDSYQLLQRQLRDSDNCMATIAQHFGRGLFSPKQHLNGAQPISELKVQTQPRTGNNNTVTLTKQPNTTTAAVTVHRSPSPLNPFGEDEDEEYPDDLNPFE